MLSINKRYFITFLNIACFIVVMLFLSCSTDKSAMKDDAPFAAEESLQKANELIQDGYYEDARELLETIKAKDATRKYALLAMLRIADSYFDDGSYEEAVVEYESFLDSHPYHKYSPYAQYKLALCYYSRIQSVDISYSWARKALSEFEKLQKRYPRNPYMAIIDSRIQSCRSMLAEYEFYVGNFYFKKDSYNAAIIRFKGLIEDYPGSSPESDALYYLGVSYEKLGQRDQAVNTLTALIEKFPTIEMSTKARKLMRSFDEEK